MDLSSEWEIYTALTCLGKDPYDDLDEPYPEDQLYNYLSASVCKTIWYEGFRLDAWMELDDFVHYTYLQLIQRSGQWKHTIQDEEHARRTCWLVARRTKGKLRSDCRPIIQARSLMDEDENLVEPKLSELRDDPTLDRPAMDRNRNRLRLRETPFEELLDSYPYLGPDSQKMYLREIKRRDKEGEIPAGMEATSKAWIADEALQLRKSHPRPIWRSA